MFDHDKAINRTVLWLSVLVPIFFLPISTGQLGMDNFGKNMLLLLVIPILFFIAFINSVREGKLTFRWFWLDTAILAYLVISLAAAWLSLDPHSSFFGGYNFIAYPFIATAVLALWYFFVSAYYNGRSRTIGIIRALLAGYDLVLAAAVIILLALGTGWLIGGNRLVGWFSAATGSLDDLAMLAAVMGVIVIGLMAIPGAGRMVFRKSWEKLAALAAAAGTLWLLLAVNATAAWLAFSLGLGAVIIGCILYPKSAGTELPAKPKKKAVISLLLILMLSVLFLISDLRLPGRLEESRRFAQELKLDYTNSISVVGQAMAARPILGYGQENFQAAYSLFRDPAANNTPYWHLRFARSASFFLESFATTGWAGGLALAAVIILSLILFIKRFIAGITGKSSDFSRLAPVLAAAGLALLAALVFYTVNAVLWFLFWTVLALLARERRKSLPARTFITSRAVVPSLYYGGIGLLFIIITAWVGAFAWSVKIALARNFFQNGTAPLPGIERAVGLDSYYLPYLTVLAKRYKDEAVKEFSPAASQDELARVADLANRAIDEARLAVRTAPWSVSAYETLGIIYRDIAPFSPDSYNLAALAFAEAAKREPSNPVLYLELGKARLAAGDNAGAISALRQAVALKDGYADADLNLARAYTADSQENKALDILNRLVRENPGIEVFYEQGHAYFNQKNYELAIKSFRQVITLDPLHANALYSLGLALEATGQYDEALSYYKKVQDLNPTNEEVRQKIEDLNNITR